MPLVQNGIVQQPYTIQVGSLQDIAGFYNQIEDNQVYSRACFLTQDRSLMCEPVGMANSTNGTLVAADPGTQWKIFALPISQPSVSCGVTVGGDVRCLKNYTGLNKPIEFETIASGAVFSSGDYFFFNDGFYRSVSQIRARGAGNLSSVRFAGDVAGHPSLFYGTDGKLYTSSYQGPKEVTQAQFMKIRDAKLTSPISYYDATTRRCYNFGLGELYEHVCTDLAYSNFDLRADYVFASVDSRVYVTRDGRIYGPNNLSSHFDFIPPQAMEPVD
jgi:hypothetical protein